LVDRIYRIRENLAWRKERGIRLNGPKLGRPPRDRQACLEALELERQEYRASATRLRAVSVFASAGTVLIW
jgi:hypothetical protein